MPEAAVQAVTFQGPGNVELREVPDPRIEQPTDALVRVTTSTICGTDIRIFWGHVLPLAEAPRAYQMTAGREDGALKVLLKP